VLSCRHGAVILCWRTVGRPTAIFGMICYGMWDGRRSSPCLP
jgi:hypothetical protein